MPELLEVVPVRVPERSTLPGSRAVASPEWIDGVLQRRVICVIDSDHRDLSVAAAACQGRFTHAGTTLSLGLTPDWANDGLADDEEWRIEWVKFYEGLDLAHAYLTEPGPQLRVWETLVSRFCAQVPVGADTSDVSARRLQNWIYAWQRFASAPHYEGLSPAFVRVLLNRIAADALHLRANLTAERNHRTLELYALFLVALAFPDLRDTSGRPWSEELLRDAIDDLADNAVTDLLADGVQRERSSDYHGIVVRSFVGVLRNAERYGLDVPEALVDRVSRACTFLLALQRPDGLTPSVSDGDVADFRALLADAAEVLSRPDLRWAASGGAAGSPAADVDHVFEHGGYVTMRSGWGNGTCAYDREAWLLFDCGPLGDGGHGHYDHLSVELAASGSSIAVDPGRFTYAEESGGWRRWFKGTAAHNTVCVDGLDQTPYRRGKPKGPVSTAWLVGHRSERDFAAVEGRATSPCYDAVHTRRIAFVDRRVWIVIDVLDAPSVHTYDLRWHLPAGAEVSVTSVAPLPGNTSVASVVATGAALVCVDGASEVRVEEGWVSPTYGTRHAAPVVVATRVAAAARFITLVAPDARRAHLAATGDDIWIDVEFAATEAGIAGHLAWPTDGGVETACWTALDGTPAARLPRRTVTS
jgi:hypothetical protein